MSGGYFDYNQFHIDEIAREIERFLDERTDSDWDKQFYSSLSEKTIEAIREYTQVIKKAAIYAHRIDYLLSGDDGEESFHRRVEEDLAKLDENV